jgi:hypothetical protein
MKISPASDRGFGLSAIMFVVAGLVVLSITANYIMKSQGPKWERARQQANEASAVASLRAINAAQALYAANCGQGYFAPTLSGLAIKPDSTEEPFVIPELAAADTVVRDGYVFSMASSDGLAAPSRASCNGLAEGTLASGYFVTAVPQTGAGIKSFGTNTSATVFEAEQTAPLAMTNTSTPEGATAVQ